MAGQKATTQIRDTAGDELPRGIAQPALRALASIGVTRLSQLAAFKEADVLALHGMGPKAMGLIRAALRDTEKGFAT